MSGSRRIKRKLVFPNEENKKNEASDTVWSEEDELSLLKSMIDYEVTKQTNPYDDMGKFLEFVRPSLHFNVQRKQLTNKLWKLKNKFFNYKYDSTISHHANLLDLSKSITSWGQHAKMSLDGQNVVTTNDQNVNQGNVVENEKKGKLVSGDGRNGEKENVDVRVDKGLKIVEKKRKLLSRDGENVEEVNVGKCSKKKGKVVFSEDQNNKEDDVVDAGKGELSKSIMSSRQHANMSHYVTSDDQNVEEDNVIDDIELDKLVDKLSKVDENEKKGKLVHGGKKGKSSKKKGKAVNFLGQGNKKDDIGVEDDAGNGKGELVIKGKRKGGVLTHDDRNVDVRDNDKLLNAVENEKKGELFSGDGQNSQKDNVAIDDDVCVDKGLKVVTKKRKPLSWDGENVKEVNVRKCSKKKGKVVISDDQDNKGDDVVIDDVDAGKGEILVKDKSKEDVVTLDDQNVQEDTIVDAVVTDVQSPKKKCKKRVKALDDEPESREVNREDLKDIKSMFPELTNMLELETLSWMPLPLRKKCVMDTFNTVGWEKAIKLEEGWADVRLMEMELEAKKFDLKSKQMNLILEAKCGKFRP